MTATELPNRGVYFLRAGSSGPVKIGFSKNVQARVRKLNTAFPEEGQLLAVLPSLGPGPERALHELLDRDRTRPRGEWFEPSLLVMGIVAAVRAVNEQADAPELEGVPVSALPESMRRAARARIKGSEW